MSALVPRLCGMRHAVGVPHEPLDFGAWVTFLETQHSEAQPLKTLLINCKEKAQKLLYTLPANQRADLKGLGRATGLKPNSMRVATPKDTLEAFQLPEGSVLSLLHLMQNPAQFLQEGVSCCFDAGIVSQSDKAVLSQLRYALLHPTAGQGSVLVEFQNFVDSIYEMIPKEKLILVEAVDEKTASEGSTETKKPNAQGGKAPSSQHVAKAGASNEPEGTGLTIKHSKEENFQEWYAEVLSKADLIEYHDVSGCYILRPWAFEMWDLIKNFLDHEIKEDGVENCYFPLFISKSALEREKDHVEGFAPEVAWVTKSGESELAEPIAIRPTSETVMYPSYAKWIRSHRDLPLRLNQWCNVVRWEFSHPMPFIRTREFLWQEGHTAWTNLEDATKEVHWSLNLYRRVYEEVLAVPVIPGRKTDKEKFAGALFTTTVETFVPTTGRGCQGGTSHCLGQSFAKMFEIQFEDENKQRQYVWQNSWGMTTRTIGVMVMVHGDDKGLVLPPGVAFYQVVIVPCGIQAKTSEEEKNALIEACSVLAKKLKASGIRAHADLRMHQSPGWRYNYWEQRGVPLRIELGPRELKSDHYVVCRRDTGVKADIPRENVEDHLRTLLTKVRDDMFAKAKASRDERLVTVTKWEDFVPVLNRKCIIYSPWCGETCCEDEVKRVSGEESKKMMQDQSAEDARMPSMGAKSLCIPFEQPKVAEGIENLKCIAPSCTKKAQKFVLFGRSY